VVEGKGFRLRAAAGLITMDRGIEFQQDLTTVPSRVLLFRASSNRVAHLQPLVPAILGALPGGQAGTAPTHRRITPTLSRRQTTLWDSV
jgi:hypothetical protein